MNAINYFNSHVLEYDKWYDCHPDIFGLELALLKRAVNIRHPTLEIGVGTGRFARELSIDFGIDPAFNMLRLARERGLSVVCGLGEAMPFESNSFSTALLIATLEFVSDPEKVLEESRRVLIADGDLVIAFIEQYSELCRDYQKKGGFYEFARFLTREELRRKVGGAGYKNIEIISSGIPGFLILKAN